MDGPFLFDFQQDPDLDALPFEQRRLIDLIRSGENCAAWHRNIALVRGKGDDFTIDEGCASSAAIDGMDKSWELLRIFYPDFRMGQGPALATLRLTENPYGDIDVLPADAVGEELSQYRCLVMTGWNIADADFSTRMLEYVRGGGTLLLTWAHLYTSPDRNQALSHQSAILLNDAVRAMTGVQDADFRAEIPVLTPSVSGRGNGWIDHRTGRGRVLLLNSKCYPGERPIRRAYAALVRRIAREFCAEECKWGWVSADRGIHTAACDAEDRRIFYLVDVRRGKAAVGKKRAALHMGEAVCGFPVERGVVNVMTLFPGIGVLTVDGTTDVIALEGDCLILRGVGQTKIVLFRWAEGEIHISERRLELNGTAAEKI